MKVRVLDPKAPVHAAASLESVVIAELFAGDELDVGKTVRVGGASWVEAALPDGRTGFVLGTIRILRIRQVALAQGNVDVRDSPNDDADVQAILNQGDTFTLAGLIKTGGTQWIEVRNASGRSGFIPGATRIKEIRRAVEGAEEKPATPPPETETQETPAPRPQTTESESGAALPVSPQPPPAPQPQASEARDAWSAPAELKVATDGEFQSFFAKEGIERIQAVAQIGAVQGAVVSLVIWGVVNIVGWALLGSQSRAIIDQLTPSPNASLFYLAYGSLIFGIVMLAFAALGLLTRSYVTLFLDGLSLVAIGLSNITSDIIAINALRPYGYTVNNPASFWVILGVFQVIWGVRRFSAFWRVGTWSTAKLSGRERAELRKRLQGFVKLAQSIENGIVKASITANTLGIGILGQTTYYTGILLADSAVLVADSLDDFFAIGRDAIKRATFTIFGYAELQVEKKKKDLGVDAVSIVALKLWTGRPIIAIDMDRLKKEKTASLTLLGPYLQAEDVQLRAAAVSALGILTDPEARQLAVSFMENPAAPVKAAAIDACRQLKIAALQEKVSPLMTAPEPALRIAAVKYLAAFPSERGLAAIERAADTEKVRVVKKEIARAQRAVRR